MDSYEVTVPCMLLVSGGRPTVQTERVKIEDEILVQLQSSGLQTCYTILTVNDKFRRK